MAAKKRTLEGSNCSLVPGLQGLKKGDRNKLNLSDLNVIESLNIDKCFEKAEPHAFRWDYYIGIQRKGELYVEVHEVSEDELPRLLGKAQWLRDKIDSLNWPQTDGRPLIIAPTKGISPFSAYGEFRKRLALQKISIAMKGDRIADLIG